MKRILIVLVAVLFTAGLVNAQIKVDCNGRVGIGLDPDGTYNLSPHSAIFKAGGSYPDLIIGPNPSQTQSRAIYPSVTNSCSIGWSTNQFNTIYAQTHYANLVQMTSDRRLKENFRAIDQPLDKILQMSGQKYDFISQRTDTIKDEKDKKDSSGLNKTGLGS